MQPVAMNTTPTIRNGKRNPNISKWNILFEREGKQWMSVRPQEGTEVYTCYACRELFCSKSSFLDHVNRFTILLSFKCEPCLIEEIIFYNPCALLIHSRGHYSPFGGQINLDNIKVSCLPYGLIGFPPHSNIPLYYNVREEPTNGANVNTRFYAPTKVAKGRNIIPMVPTILLFYHYRLNGIPPASLILKQTCINVPKCIFVRLETNTVSTNNVVTTSMEKTTVAPQSTGGNIGRIEEVVEDERCENGKGTTRDVEDNNAEITSEKENTQDDNNKNREIQTSNGRNEEDTQVGSTKETRITNKKNKKDTQVDCNNETRATNKKNKKDTQDDANKKKQSSSARNGANDDDNNKGTSINTTEESENSPQENITIKKEVDDSEIGKEPTPMPAETAENPINPLGALQPEVKLEEPEEGSFCPECKVIIPCDQLLSEHFTSTGPLNDAYSCHICKYIAATKCSLRSHKRLHSRRPPYICPECGKTFADNMSLLDHLEDVCFHLAKQVRLRCPKKNCCKVFAQLSTFMTHFEVHIQTLNKCTMCDATYYAVRDFVEHGQTVHKQIVPVQLIYKCTICKNSALEGYNYREHVNWHCIDKTLRVYVYVCKLCRNFFRSALTYSTHLTRCTKKELTIEELRRLKKCNTAVVCLHCNYVIRLITKLPDCPRCSTYIDNTSVQSYLAEKSVNTTFEMICNNNSNPSSSGDKAPSRTIKCILCYEDLIVSETSAHECKYKNPQVVLIREEENIRRMLSIKHESNDVTIRTESNPKKKRRKISTSPLLPKHKKSRVELRLDEPTPFEGTYTCKVCEYKDNDRTSFHEHIKEHKNVSTAYQCMECGECFVVKPSLHKHLMYYHKINNVDNYIKENECVDQGAISELEKHMRIESGEINDDVAENQCKVCLKQFEDSLELNKHFRIHGMAFLRNNK